MKFSYKSFGLATATAGSALPNFYNLQFNALSP